jgi:hypothetical protein
VARVVLLFATDCCASLHLPPSTTAVLKPVC